MALLLALALLGGGVAHAAFSGTADNGPNSFTAAPDFLAPSASSSVVAKATGYLAGKIRQAGNYYVYANVTDTGNPASGVSSVTANVSTVTAGQTTLALVSGSFSSEGASYNYRSASVMADSLLAAGSKSYSLTMTDAAANSQTQPGFGVTVDNTAPTGSDVQTANTSGGTVGRPELGDTLKYTHSEQMEPDSLLPGWAGPSTNIVVRIINAGNNDTATVFDATNTTQVRLGSVALNGNYVANDRTFGASGTASTMVQAGSVITVTLGTASGGARTEGIANPVVWTTSPPAGATDAASNALTAGNINETGLADVEF